QKPGYTALYYAAKNGDFESVIAILAAAGNEVQRLVMMVYEYNTTVLHAAAFGGCADICRWILLLAGNDNGELLLFAKNGETFGGGHRTEIDTPLHIAVRCGHFEVVKELVLKAGIRAIELINEPNYIGTNVPSETPLDIASSYAAYETDKTSDRSK